MRCTTYLIAFVAFTILILLNGCVIIGSDIQIRKVKDSRYYENEPQETIQNEETKSILQRQISLESLQSISTDATSSFIISLVDQATGFYSEIQTIVISNDSLLLRIINKDKAKNVVDSFNVILDRRYIEGSTLSETAHGYMINKSISTISLNEEILPDSIEVHWSNQLFIKDFNGFDIEPNILHLYSGSISSSQFQKDEAKFIIINDLTEPKYIEDAFSIYFLFKNSPNLINEKCKELLKKQCFNKELFLMPHKSREGFISTTVKCYGKCID